MNISSSQVEAIVRRILGENMASAPKNAAIPKTAKVAMLTAQKKIEVKEFPIPALQDDDILVKVEGCGVLAGFGSANPVTDEDYTDEVTVSYRGRAMAIIRSGYESGTVRVEVSAEGMATVKVELSVK